MGVEDIILNITKRLSEVQGVTAIALGGSRARGTHNEKSDIDIGIYYNSEASLDITALRKISKDMDDIHRSGLITDIGEWGPWINGGGWLTIDGYAVDWLFRDLNKVSAVIDKCLAGEITIDYYPGHPHGFINSIYLAETALCRVLWDPQGILDNLKKKTSEYSVIFKQAILDKFLWEASFSLSTAAKGIPKQDVYYIAGCCFRTVSCLNQVIFAQNEQYCMNEKGALHLADTFHQTPADYKNRIELIFSLLPQGRAACEKALEQLAAIIREVSLVG